MNAESFAYWLQGYFEISGNSTLSDTQVQIIKDHLALVFNKVTPERQRQVDYLKNKTAEFSSWKNGGIEYLGTTPVQIPSQESVDKLREIFKSNGNIGKVSIVDNIGDENMRTLGFGTTVYTDNHPLAEIIIPHSC